jgi:NADH-quinone oxidoreductase subunit G
MTFLFNVKKNIISSVENNLKNKINILHAYANTVGSFDLGIQPSISNKLEQNLNLNNIDCLYLLGVDYSIYTSLKQSSTNKVTSENKDNKNNIVPITKKPFIIYQGHHGDIGAKQANIILPVTTYVEKTGTYVNTEGLVQQTQIAIQSEFETRDD